MAKGTASGPGWTLTPLVPRPTAALSRTDAAILPAPCRTARRHTTRLGTQGDEGDGRAGCGGENHPLSQVRLEIRVAATSWPVPRSATSTAGSTRRVVAHPGNHPARHRGLQAGGRRPPLARGPGCHGPKPCTASTYCRPCPSAPEARPLRRRRRPFRRVTASTAPRSPSSPTITGLTPSRPSSPLELYRRRGAWKGAPSARATAGGLRRTPSPTRACPRPHPTRSAVSTKGGPGAWPAPWHAPTAHRRTATAPARRPHRPSAPTAAVLRTGPPRLRNPRSRRPPYGRTSSTGAPPGYPVIRGAPGTPPPPIQPRQPDRLQPPRAVGQRLRHRPLRP